MTLIKSISGIRGTIGGPAGDTLNPLDIVKFTSAYATFIRRSGQSSSNTIVVGRDARISGEMVKNVVCGTLMGMGYDVLNIGLATTPTTELAVTMSGAAGGIIITASHNPRQWNALKLLNEKGEFLTAANGNEVPAIIENRAKFSRDKERRTRTSTSAQQYFFAIKIVIWKKLCIFADGKQQNIKTQRYGRKRNLHRSCQSLRRRRCSLQEMRQERSLAA